MLTFGALLVCGTLLTLAALTVTFRQPAPPRWTTRAGVGEFVTIGLVSCFAFGFGYLGAGAVRAYQNGLDLLDVGALIAVLAASFLIWRRLNVRERLRLVEGRSRADAPATVPGAAARGEAAMDTGPVPAHPAERAA